MACWMMLHTKHLLGDKAFLFLAIAYHGFITVLMVLPTSDLPSWELPNLDKMVHAGIYFSLYLLWGFVLFRKKYSMKKHLITIAILLFIYGMVIEVVQGAWVVSRTFDLWDVAANTVGILFGGIVLYKISRSKVLKN